MIQDKDAGIISGKIIVPNVIFFVGGVHMTVNFKAKNNKYRVSFNDYAYYHQGPSRDVMPGNEHENAIKASKKLAKELKLFILKKVDDDF